MWDWIIHYAIIYIKQLADVNEFYWNKRAFILLHCDSEIHRYFGKRWIAIRSLSLPGATKICLYN